MVGLNTAFIVLGAIFIYSLVKRVKSLEDKING